MNGYSNKTILITGATGLIGNHLVDAFMEMGDVKVIALSRNIDKLKFEFRKYLDNQRFGITAQDISTPLEVEGPIGYIFHAAGPMEGKVIKNYPVDVIKPNLIGTINCLEFLKEQKERTGVSGRMVLFSSVTVYANNTNSDLTVSETDTQIAESLESGNAPYSQSKRMAEVITTAYIRQYGVDAVIGRFSTVYGPTRIMPDTAFYEFIKKALSGEDILMNGSGLPRRDNIYIDDAVKGVLLVGEKGVTGEAYNISSEGELGNYISVDEIAQKVISISEKTIKVQFKIKPIKERKPGIRLANRKLKELGWKLMVSLEDGIKKTLRAEEPYDIFL